MMVWRFIVSKHHKIFLGGILDFAKITWSVMKGVNAK